MRAEEVERAHEARHGLAYDDEDADGRDRRHKRDADGLVVVDVDLPAPVDGVLRGVALVAEARGQRGAPAHAVDEGRALALVLAAPALPEPATPVADPAEERALGRRGAALLELEEDGEGVRRAGP